MVSQDGATHVWRDGHGALHGQTKGRERDDLDVNAGFGLDGHGGAASGRRAE